MSEEEKELLHLLKDVGGDKMFIYTVLTFGRECNCINELIDAIKNDGINTIKEVSDLVCCLFEREND